jgi:glycosyltransferase involved in cell wall biosynthesis
MLGSVHRVGREAPAYQESRRAAMLDFVRAYVGGRHQFVRSYLRELETANQWLKDQHGQNAADELRTWAERLERELRARTAAAERAYAEQRAWIARLEQSLEQANANVASVCEELRSKSAQADELAQRLTDKAAEADRIWQALVRTEQNLADKSAEADRIWRAQMAADQRVGELQSELAGIYNSTGWRVLQVLYRIRFFIFPRGSRRERAAKRCMHAQRRLRQRFGGRFRPTPDNSSAGAGPGHGSTAASPSPITAAVATSSKTVESGVPGLVSVVLPVYNQADMLRESIESVLAQTYPDFELIVVNDGSTDGVEQVLAEYAGHPKVRCLSQANQKLPKALSNGFEFARGQFCTWTSADNLMEPRQLERQVEFLRSHPEFEMVYCDYLAIDDRGLPLRDPSFRPHNRRRPDAPEIHLPRDPARLNDRDDNFIGACFMYRGWVGRLMGEYAPSLGVEDFDYWLRLNKLFRIAHLGSDELLYRYRVHDNTLNARAAEHRIAERVQRLMGLDRRRQAFYARPWTILADEQTRAWLSQVVQPPNTITDLLSESAPPAATDAKTMYMVRADRLPQLPRRPHPHQACVVAWFDADPRAPYQYSDAVRNVADLCFAADAKTTARLELQGGRGVQAAPGPALWSAAASFANNELFFRTTTPARDRRRTLPQLLRSQRRLRVLLQVDHFLQGGFEQVVMDIAQVLDPQRFEIAILALGREAQVPGR